MESNELLGKQVFGNWVVKELIGTGSFGNVYRIERNEYGHSYVAAMKSISIPAASSEIEEIRAVIKSEEEVRDYFKNIVDDLVNEITMMDKLKGNSNIVSYEDHLVIQKKDKLGFEIYIRMEILTPLNIYIEQKDFTVADIIILGINICRALEICHNNNIIHRDIKPQNIYVSKFGDYKLGDFGIAKQMERDSLVQSKKGTFAYMAPEVYLGKAYEESVDTYSLGLVLYRLLNDNRTPFLPYHPTAITYEDKELSLTSRMSGMPIPPPRIAIEPLVKIILKACAFKAEDRYEEAVQMRSDLERIDLNYYRNFKISANGTDINEASNSKLFGGNASFAIPNSIPVNKQEYEESTVWGKRETVKQTTEDYSGLFDSNIKETSSNKDVLEKTMEDIDKKLKDNKKEGFASKIKKLSLNKKVAIIAGMIFLLLFLLVMCSPSTDSANRTNTNTATEATTNSVDKPTTTTKVQRNGFEKVTYTTGTFEGNFANGKRQGKGIYLYSNGNKYEGEWVNDLKEGKGKFTFADGTVCEGIWKAGMRNGSCETRYPNGNIYQGIYVNDLRQDTKGKFTYSNGTVHIGVFEKDNMTGYGERTFADGGSYKGDFVNGLREGKGVYRYPNGDYYDGEWKKDNRNGKGYFYYASSNKLVQEVWENGKRVTK
jgi:serine/threonine protein kinase